MAICRTVCVQPVVLSAILDWSHESGLVLLVQSAV